MKMFFFCFFKTNYFISLLDIGSKKWMWLKGPRKLASALQRFSYWPNELITIPWLWWAIKNTIMTKPLKDKDNTDVKCSHLLSQSPEVLTDWNVNPDLKWRSEPLRLSDSNSRGSCQINIIYSHHHFRELLGRKLWYEKPRN